MIPDLKFKFENGNLIITTASSDLPEIIFDEDKFATLQNHSDKSDRKYFTKQKKNFTELHHAIQQREATLLKLGKFLGRKQKKYLHSLREEDLVSLKLADAASELDVAISTISRAIKDKYAECQGKIFSLKNPFS